MSNPVLDVSDLTIQYSTDRGSVTAVSDASFTIDEGEYFGLVGESGCGKSTIARAVMGALDDNGQVTSGTIRVNGEEIQDYSTEEMNERIRWKKISFIPQSSMNNLDPLLRIEKQAKKLASIHTDMSPNEASERLAEMFEIVGLSKARISDYPHQFSGGMQQRAVIAMALFLDPDLIVADEPTTALDVIMQDQLFKYLDNVREDLDTSMMLITHDMSIIYENCNKLAIMHSGQVAEYGYTNNVLANPRHPYTIQLKQAFPDVHNPDKELGTVKGTPPKTMGEVDYCTFAERCPWATEECAEVAPSPEEIGDSDLHTAACFRLDEVYRDEYAGEQAVQDQQKQGGSL
ncbi:ABC transporter ATP-binding protein [Halobellus salinisoli]|uniref:ABC transporter ATP-binding protein n=1 Tax=Halobellus salinisoli TaxID=3108500 RepID=UPI003008CE89